LKVAGQSVRPTRVDEGEALREIERRAGQRFHDVGLHHVADDEPASFETLREYALSGRSWVAVDGLDEPVGYVIVDVIDGQAHIEQISVRPDHQGNGLGRALLERVCEWARDQLMAAVTLTTFTDVPWNRPLYEHLGFVVLKDDQIGPELRLVRAHESDVGLDPTQRVCMRLDLEART
jgi:GNAT superfamily N-acetyltransferase